MSVCMRVFSDFARLRTGLKAFPVAAWGILSYAKLRASGRFMELAWRAPGASSAIWSTTIRSANYVDRRLNNRSGDGICCTTCWGCGSHVGFHCSLVVFVSFFSLMLPCRFRPCCFASGSEIHAVICFRARLFYIGVVWKFIGRPRNFMAYHHVPCARLLDFIQ